MMLVLVQSIMDPYKDRIEKLDTKDMSKQNSISL